MIGWTFRLSLSKQTNQITSQLAELVGNYVRLRCEGATTEASDRPVSNQNAMQCLSKLTNQELRKVFLVLFFALLWMRKCCPVLIKLTTVQHPRCFGHQASSSFMFVVTAKPWPQLPPISPQRMQIGPVIFWPTKGDSDWLLTCKCSDRKSLQSSYLERSRFTRKQFTR